MSYMLSYLRWRIITGLVMFVVSIVLIGMTGGVARMRYAQPSDAEVEQVRQEHEQYLAEREIRRARQTGGYDPSDPSLLRDGYPQSDEARGTEPYGYNPSE